MATRLSSGSGPGSGSGLGLGLVSWNVNGIRARCKQLLPLLQRLQADIICLQETKVTRDLLDEPTAIVEGFNSYFSYSRGRSGYSGVATFCKDSVIPFAAEEGLSGILGVAPASCVLEGFSDEELRALDGEGRAVITKHRIRTRGEEEETLTVINVYCPRADPEREDRGHFKLRFYQLLQARTEALLQEGGNVIVLGDMNTAHRPIDHCQPGELDYFDKHPDRVWLNGFLSSPSELSRLDQANEISDPAPGPGARDGNGNGLFVDAFRLFHPSEREAYTCWRTSTGARKTNYGTRIDYIFANKSLAESTLQDCILMPEIEGSDHCPVRAVLKARCIPADKCPPLCTKYMPEFAGLQQKLSQFLVNVQDSQTVPEPRNNSETEWSSQPQVDPRTKEGRAAGRRTGRYLMRGRGTRGKRDPCLSGSLLRFFKPAPTSTSPALEAHNELRLSSQVTFTADSQWPAQDKEVKLDSGAKKVKLDSGAKKVKLDSGAKKVKLDSGAKKVKLDSGAKKVKLDSGAKEVKLDTGAKEVKLDTGAKEVKLDTGAKEVKFDTGAKEVKPDTGAKEVKPDTGAKEVKPDTGAKEVKPDSGAKKVKPDSGAKEIKPDTGAKEIKPDTGAKEVKPDTGAKEVKPDTGAKEVKPDSGAKKVKPDSGAKKVKLDSGAKEVKPDTGAKEVKPDTGAKKVKLDSGAKEIKPDTGAKEVKPDTGAKEVKPDTGAKEVKLLTGANEQKSESQAGFWKSLLKGLPPPPRCSGHQEPCLLRTVRKAGSNQGRQFYICARPEGPRSNPASRCNFFRWAKTT